jgi:DUF4097 and DUF4098 domain-containing protein YvlB
VIPAGSTVEVESLNGGVELRGSYGDVDLEVVNGDVVVEKARDVEIEAVNGNVQIGLASNARVESVQGDVRITTDGSAPEVEMAAVSGDLYWYGTCGNGCRISTESLSGDVVFAFGQKSAFAIKYQSHSGGVKDGLGLKVDKQKTKNKKSNRVTYLKGSLGGGGGDVNVETYSGSLELKKK